MNQATLSFRNITGFKAVESVFLSEGMLNIFYCLLHIAFLFCKLQNGPDGNMSFDMHSCSGTKDIDVISRRNYTFYVSLCHALAFILHPDHGQREEYLKYGGIPNKLGWPDSPQLGRRVTNTSNLL